MLTKKVAEHLKTNMKINFHHYADNEQGVRVYVVTVTLSGNNILGLTHREPLF